MIDWLLDIDWDYMLGVDWNRVKLLILSLPVVVLVVVAQTAWANRRRE